MFLPKFKNTLTFANKTAPPQIPQIHKIINNSNSKLLVEAVIEAITGVKIEAEDEGVDLLLDDPMGLTLMICLLLL